MWGVKTPGCSLMQASAGKRWKQGWMPLTAQQKKSTGFWLPMNTRTTSRDWVYYRENTVCPFTPQKKRQKPLCRQEAWESLIQSCSVWYSPMKNLRWEIWKSCLLRSPTMRQSRWDTDWSAGGNLWELPPTWDSTASIPLRGYRN